MGKDKDDDRRRAEEQRRRDDELKRSIQREKENKAYQDRVKRNKGNK